MGWHSWAGFKSDLHHTWMCRWSCGGAQRIIIALSTKQLAIPAGLAVCQESFIWKNGCVANVCWGSLPQLSWCAPTLSSYIQWELFNPFPLVLNTLKNKVPCYKRLNTKFENVFTILISSPVLNFICYWWIESTNSPFLWVLILNVSAKHASLLYSKSLCRYCLL